MTSALGIILLLLGGANASEKGSNKSLNALINLALDTNPTLLGRIARADAQKQVIPQSASLPEPKIFTNLVNVPVDSFSLNETPMTQFQVGINQIFPFPGKLTLKESLAQVQYMSNKSMIDHDKMMLIRELKHSWWQIYYLDRWYDAVESSRSLLNEAVDVAQTKYSVGKGNQHDILLANIEHAKLEDRLAYIKFLRKKESAKIRDIINKPISFDIEPEQDQASALPMIQKIELLIETAMERHPLLKIAGEKLNAAQGNIDLAEKEYYPDFNLGALYGWRQDDSGLASVKVSFNLPFFTENRQDKKLLQRQLEKRQQLHHVVDVKNHLQNLISVSFAKYEHAKNQAEIYRQKILPQATQSVDTVLANYQVNKADFSMLIQAQINLIDFKANKWKAISTAQQALAVLEYAVAGEIKK